MSRSYRYPIFKDKPGKKTKRSSSKKIRQWLKDEEKGFKSSKQFKHQVNQYDLVDWIWRPVKKKWIEKAKRK